MSKRLYTAWGMGREAHTVCEGSGPPVYVDGTAQPDCADHIWDIYADSWDEAMLQYHVLHGWEPYATSTETYTKTRGVGP